MSLGECDKIEGGVMMSLRECDDVVEESVMMLLRECDDVVEGV
jgi:hypothetical protein